MWVENLRLRITIALMVVALSGPKVLAAPPGSDHSTPAALLAPSETISALIVSQDRSLEKSLEIARKHCDSGEFASVVVLLQQIFDSNETSFVTTADSSTMISAREAAFQLSRRLPADVRSRLDAELERTARVHWNGLKLTGTLEEIARFAQMYRMTPAGLEAITRLAAGHRDSSRHEQAAAAWGQVLEHPVATDVQQRAALMARLSSLVALGRQAQANSELRATNLLPAGSSMMIGGRAVDPRTWLIKIGLKPETQSEVASTDTTGKFADHLPALKPVWSAEIKSFSDIHDSIAAVQRYFRDQGVVSSSALRPLVAGNIVISRTMEELTAHDIRSGERLWSVPNHEVAWLAKRPAILESGAFRTPFISAWHRRYESDSLFGSLSTDGKLITVIHEDRISIEHSSASVRPGTPNPPVTSSRWNRLCGYEIATKSLRWQIGGAPTGPADVFGGMTFQGPPLFVDDVLFGVSRREDELHLLAIDRDTGHLRWSLMLGSIPPHLVESASRQRIACPVSFNGGRLLCPTLSGTLVAVNPVSRGISWVYRYPMIQHDQLARPVNGVPSTIAPDIWWNEWREVTVFSAENSVAGSGRPVSAGGRNVTVLASPESNELHAISTNDGTHQWSASRSGALHVAGTAGNLVIVVEPMAVRAHDLQNGAICWRVETGEVSGRGTVSGDLFLQPRRAGGVAVIDLRNGVMRGFLTGTDDILGTLIPCADGWITQDDQTLRRLPRLSVLRQQALDAWDREKTETNSLDLARLDLQSGEPLAAQTRLDGLDSSLAKDLRRQSILLMLRRQLGTGDRVRKDGEDRISSADVSALSEQLRSLCETDEERLFATRALGEAAWTAGDLVTAVTLFLDGLDAIDAIGVRSLSEWPVSDVSSRTARPDRILLGSIERILLEVKSADDKLPEQDHEVRMSERLEQLLASRRMSAKQSTDPFAEQRLIDRLLPLEWGRRTLVADPSAAIYARPLMKIEPAFLAAIGSSDKATSVRAAEHLAALFGRSGWRAEADAILRRLPRDQTQTKIDSANHADLWPVVQPEVVRTTERHTDVYQFPIKVRAIPGTLLDRLDVSVDRTGTSVRFAGGGHAVPWVVKLPNSPRQLRSTFANWNLVEAYGIGRLLVLRLGSEVFGVQPLTDTGEPSKSATALQIDMSPINTDESLWMPEMVPGKVGIRHDSVRFVDGFGRTLGGLGPVRPGYFCYRSQARLVAVDTQTGRRLWQRLDLPPNCQTFGDDERIYLWRPEEHSIQTLSTIDGHSLGERPWDASPDDVVMQHDRWTWLTVGKPVTGLELIDARDGSSVWKHALPQNSIPFAVDHDTLGVVQPDGRLQFLAAETGAAVGEALTVELPEKIERIVCLQDAQRWYVAISGPVPRLSILQSEQVWGGRQMAFVHGWLYGIDRSNATISWRRFLDSESLQLEASRNAPVLVQMWRKPVTDGATNQSALGTLKLLDKRSGQEIFSHQDPSMQSYWTLHPSENHEILQMHTDRETIRLTYRQATTEKMQKRATDKP